MSLSIIDFCSVDDPVNTMIPLIPGRERFIKEGRKRGRKQHLNLISHKLSSSTHTHIQTYTLTHSLIGTQTHTEFAIL